MHTAIVLSANTAHEYALISYKNYMLPVVDMMLLDVDFHRKDSADFSCLLNISMSYTILS